MSGGMYFRGNFKRKEIKLREKKRKEGKNEKGGGCQPFPNKFYGVQRLRTSIKKNPDPKLLPVLPKP